jgi:hypothetical protein
MSDTILAIELGKINRVLNWFVPADALPGVRPGETESAASPPAIPRCPKGYESRGRGCYLFYLPEPHSGSARLCLTGHPR